MIKEGLLSEPFFDRIDYYLKSGEKTNVTNRVQALANTAKGNIEENLVRDLLVKMNTATVRLINAANDKRKFKRSADQILESEERTGCCDSSTLFVALCRARGIPAMQVITINKRDALNNPDSFNSGHFFTLCFLKGEWKLIDSDSGKTDHREISFIKFNLDNRNITNRYYAIAYTKDYSDISLDGEKIDSINSMNCIQQKAYKMCVKEDIEDEFRMGEECYRE